MLAAAMPILTSNFFLHAMIHGYDNYNYGDSSYSKYSTDNKKYESRTGSFEGYLSFRNSIT
jgi:hypothetical protein